MDVSSQPLKIFTLSTNVFNWAGVIRLSGALAARNFLGDKEVHITGTAITQPHPQNDGLRELIAACIRRERVAQRRLYDTYGSFVFGIIRRYTNDTLAAQEIQSDTFYRIFTRLDQFRFEGAFEGWMRRIAVHTIAEYFRRQRPAGISLSEDIAEVAVYNDAGGISKLAYQELLALIHDLPVMQRTVFNLFVFEQYAHKEIGALLGITENNSRWHLNDARRRLKDQIIRMNH